MYHNLFVVVSLIYFSNALCENSNSDYNRSSRGFVSNLIKYLDHVFDFLYQTIVAIYGVRVAVCGHGADKNLVCTSCLHKEAPSFRTRHGQINLFGSGLHDKLHFQFMSLTSHMDTSGQHTDDHCYYKFCLGEQPCDIYNMSCGCLQQLTCVSATGYAIVHELFRALIRRMRTYLIFSFVRTLSAVTFVCQQDLSGASIADDNARPESGNAEPIEAERISYRGFHLLRIWPRTEEAIGSLKILSEQPQVQLWLPLVKNSTVDIMLPPNIVKSVKEELTEQDIEFSILNNDIEKIISIQNIKHSDEDSKSKKANKLAWNRYYKLNDISDYLDYLQMTYPEIMDLTIIGKSAEGRDLKLVRVSAGRSKDGSNKRAIWIDGGMHAREWISTATALFIIRQLVENHKNFKNLIQDLDWYILPVANPDGYVYTHTTDRLWKKSRSMNEDFAGRYLGFWEDTTCKGVDLNRNWDYHWNEDNSDDNPCRETFPGKKAFSEPETKAMSNFINEHRDRIVIYLTLHSYSQKWLIPWTSTKTSKSDDYDDLSYMGRKAIEALKKTHGTNYNLASKQANPSFGNSDDWAKNKIGIKYSYTIQLRDKGTYGFLLPPSQILPTSKEIFTGIRTLTRSVLNNMNKNSRYLPYEEKILISNESIAP